MANEKKDAWKDFIGGGDIRDIGERSDIKDYYILPLVVDEALLIDWSLTMHSYSEDYYKWLDNLDVWKLRESISNVIVSNKRDVIHISHDCLKMLLIITPVTFRWGSGDDVGYSLKTKLYALLLRGEIVQPEMAEPVAKSDENNTYNFTVQCRTTEESRNASQDETGHENSSISGPTT